MLTNQYLTNLSNQDVESVSDDSPINLGVESNCEVKSICDESMSQI